MQYDEEQDDAALRTMIRTTRIIVICLVLGLVAFGGFVIMNRNPPAGQQQPGQLSTVAIPFVILGVVMSAVVPQILARNQAKAVAEGRWQAKGAVQHNFGGLDTDEKKLLVIYQSKTIIGCALLEGPAFFLWFVYWQEGPPWALAVCTALMLLILAHYPRRAAIKNWLDNRLREVKEQRELSVPQ